MPRLDKEASSSPQGWLSPSPNTIAVDTALDDRPPAAASGGLSAAARDGDDQAFAALSERYRKALWSYCRRATGDPHIAEDITQETLLRAWSRIGTFDPSRPMWPWLVRIAQRLCVDHQRAGARTVAAHEALRRERVHLRTSPDPTDLAEQWDLRHRLDVALSVLNARYRRLLLLHAIEGWSYRDIAAADGSTVTSVGKVLNRARARARLSLAALEQRPTL